MTKTVPILRVLATPMILLALAGSIVLGVGSDVLQLHTHEDGSIHAHSLVGNGRHHDHAGHGHGHAHHHAHGHAHTHGHADDHSHGELALEDGHGHAPSAGGALGDDDAPASSVFQLHLARTSQRSSVTALAVAPQVAFAGVCDPPAEAVGRPAPSAAWAERSPAGTRVQTLLRCSGALRL